MLGLLEISNDSLFLTILPHFCFYFILFFYFSLQILQMAFWTKFNHVEMTILEAVEALNALVDESDPDVRIWKL